jgi:hypothetical protein
MFTIS